MSYQNISKKVELKGLWKREGRNGKQFLGGRINDHIIMHVYKQKKKNDGSPDYVAWWTPLDKNNNFKKTHRNESLRLADLRIINDGNGKEYLWGEISYECYLMIEQEDKGGKNGNHPDYIAYICELEKETTTFNIDSISDDDFLSNDINDNSAAIDSNYDCDYDDSSTDLGNNNNGDNCDYGFGDGTDLTAEYFGF